MSPEKRQAPARPGAAPETRLPVDERRTPLRELALLFARLGATAFGGPAAHIAMMRDEVVTRRRWLSDARFLDLLGATNLIPGPNSTEMAIHIGWDRRRFAGLVVAGLAFIVPAMLITGLLGWAYVECAGSLAPGSDADPREAFASEYQTAAGWLLYGAKPVILAVILQALWGLAPRAARTNGLRALGALAALAVALGVNELAVLFGAGFVAILARTHQPPTDRHTRAHDLASPLLGPLLAGSALGTTALATAVTLPTLFGVFFKAGAVLFGSGYVLLAYLRADLVEHLGWMTESQLVDAIAIGQVTPGPVFTTATFIGWVLAGPAGAVVATVAIFLPAFVYVALSARFIPRLRASPKAAAFLDGVNVASLALMAVVTVQLAGAAFVDAPTVVLGLAGAVLLVRTKLNSTWLVLGGAAAGWLVHAIGLAGG